MTGVRHGGTERMSARAAALDLEGASIVVGAAALVVGVIVSAPFFWGRSLPIAGPGSCSQFAALAAGVIGVAAYVVGRLWHRTSLTAFGGRPDRPAGESPAPARRPGRPSSTPL